MAVSGAEQHVFLISEARKGVIQTSEEYIIGWRIVEGGRVMPDEAFDVTDGVRYSFYLAQDIAASKGWENVGVDHTLVGIFRFALEERLDTPENLNEEALKKEHELLLEFFETNKINLKQLKNTLENSIPQINCPGAQDKILHRDEACKALFKRSKKLASDQRYRFVSTFHLLKVACDPGVGEIAGVLNDEKLIGQISMALTSFCSPETGSLDPLCKSLHVTPNLDKYAHNLTEMARRGRLGDIVGRRQEILNLARYLLAGRNVALVGGRGVGKSKIIDGFAKRIAEKKDARGLWDIRLLRTGRTELTRGSVSPEGIRKRVQGLIEEISRYQDFYMVIEEPSLLAARGGGGVDALIANLLGPAVIGCTVRCILCASVEDYIRYIENDNELCGQFVRLEVEEPAIEDARGIVRNEVERIKASRSGILEVEDGALEAALSFSRKYITNKSLPGAAIDLICDAVGVASLPVLNSDPNAAQDSSLILTQGEIRVSKHEVVKAVSNRTGLSEEIVENTLDQKGFGRLEGLKSYLFEKIKGQEQAIEETCRILVVSFAGLSPRRGPIATLLFYGPTGVGKTETAKLIAEFLFGEGRFKKLDMTEYKEEHSISKIIGSPPGYVGYEEEGILTGWLRGRPHSLILLDEIEKAHENVMRLFYQLLDEGRITDAKGRVADATQAILVMTSNATPSHAPGFGAQGFTQASSRGGLEGSFEKAFLNRIDGVVQFNRLEEEEQKSIAEVMIKEIGENLLRKYGCEVEIDHPAVIDLVVKKGFSADYGAREMRRAVRDLIETPLAMRVVADEEKRGTYKIKLEGKVIVVERVRGES